MNTPLHRSLWSVAAIFALLPGPLAAGEAAAPFSRCQDRGGARVCQRPVSGSPIDELQAELVVNAPLPQVQAVLRDVLAHPRIIPTAADARLLRREGAATWYYMAVHQPWLSRRDYCIRVTGADLPGGRAVIDWTEDNGAVCPPAAAGVVRIRRNTGRWLLSPEPAGRTRVTYQAHTEYGGAVPAWMVNAGAARTIPRILRAVETAAQHPPYASLSPSR